MPFLPFSYFFRFYSTRVTFQPDGPEHGTPRTTTERLKAEARSAADSSTEEPIDSNDENPPPPIVHEPGFLERRVAGLPPFVANCILRALMSVVMIGGFLTLVYLGPLALVVLVSYLKLYIVFLKIWKKQLMHEHTDWHWCQIQFNSM